MATSLHPLSPRGAKSQEETLSPASMRNLENINRYNKDFVKCLQTIKTRHDPVVNTIAQGIIELKGTWTRQRSSELQSQTLITRSTAYKPEASVDLPSDIHEFLDRFYMSRIGIME